MNITLQKKTSVTTTQSDVSTLLVMGNQFYNEKNYAKAFEYYTKAANQGNAQAQCNLGFCYDKGQGVAQSYTEAVKWYRKAADQGFARAQYNLGVSYEKGEGVAQSYTEAVKWYRKAADQGYASAQSNLGYCYKYGQGVAQSYTEAVKWYRKAADQGLALAQNNLGVCYEKGEGVAQSYTEAMKWYRKAADQGNALAQYNLGNLYKEGKGVVTNSQTAKYWYEKAASQGHKEAKKALDEINAMEAASQEYRKSLGDVKVEPRIVQSKNVDSPLRLIANDVTAKTENVCDHNGMPTALIKVITTARGLYFHVEGKEGFPKVVKVEQKTGEVWVYVPQGVTGFSVIDRHNNVWSVSSDKPIVEAGKTYKMTLGWDTEKIPQTSTVTGQVVDAKTGEPLIAVSVQVVGTQLGTVTDINGKFVIKNVPDSASTLRICYIGYEMEEETIYPSEMKIFMKPESSSSSRKSKKR